MNIDQVIGQYLSTHTVDELSAIVHEPRERTQAALHAAVPSILLVLTDKCSTPEGSDMAFRLIRDRGPSLLENLHERISNGAAHLLIESGNRHLSSMMKPGGSDDLIYAISRFADISRGAARSLTGFATAITFGAISRHVEADSATELCMRLNEHKDSAMAALPGGIYEYFEERGSLRPLAHQYDSGSPATSTDDLMADEAEIPRQENVHNDRYYAVDRSEPIPRVMSWFIPLLILLAIAGALIFAIYPSGTNTPAESIVRSPDTENAIPSAGRLTPVEPLRLPNHPQLALELNTWLSSIKPALAEQGPGARDELSLRYEKLMDMVPRIEMLPPAEQQAVAQRLRDELPHLEQAATKLDTQSAQSRDLAKRILAQVRALANQPT